MTLPDLKSADWTDGDLEALRVAVLAEQRRREEVRDAAPSARAIIIGFMESTGEPKGTVVAIAQQILDSIPDQIEDGQP